MNFEQFLQIALDAELKYEYRNYSDWNYCIDGRFDVYLPKNNSEKWYDRMGVYGTRYDFEELLHILKTGPEMPKDYNPNELKIPKFLPKQEEERPEPKYIRPLYEIVDDLENLLTELKEHL